VENNRGDNNSKKRRNDMSEFYCSKGHLITGGLRCKKCGGMPVSSSEDNDFAHDRMVEDLGYDPDDDNESEDNKE